MRLIRPLNRKIVTGIVAVLAVTLTIAASRAFADPPIDKLKLPPGFTVELLAKVPDARQMAWGDGRVLYVGSRVEGKVYAIELDANYRAGPVRVVAKELNRPIGVAFRDGSLYVSTVQRILRYDNITAQLAAPPKPAQVGADFPTESEHGNKFIAFGPDGWLYVPVGAPCNICAPDPDRYAMISRMKPDGSQREVFARGIRNTVGFDWQPGSKELWFTDNGRDLLGDDAPPDELNHAPRAGLHFGYPYCHGGTIADPEFGKQHACSEFTAPAQQLGAHVASLGMRFYTGTQFPPAYRNQVFIAEHGSWNRSKKSGYRVTLVKLNGSKAVSYEPFITGWQDTDILRRETQWGRPVDLLVLPDGSLLISDDYAGAVYRVSYKGK